MGAQSGSRFIRIVLMSQDWMDGWIFRPGRSPKEIYLASNIIMEYVLHSTYYSVLLESVQDEDVWTDRHTNSFVRRSKVGSASAVPGDGSLDFERPCGVPYRK